MDDSVLDKESELTSAEKQRTAILATLEELAIRHFRGDLDTKEYIDQRREVEMLLVRLAGDEC